MHFPSNGMVLAETTDDLHHLFFSFFFFFYYFFFILVIITIFTVTIVFVAVHLILVNMLFVRLVIAFITVVVAGMMPGVRCPHPFSTFKSMILLFIITRGFPLGSSRDGSSGRSRSRSDSRTGKGMSRQHALPREIQDGSQASV